MTAHLERKRDTLPAGVLALLVHGAFFSVLYFGFNWQSHRPVPMMVEMWDALPEMAQPPAPAPEPEPEPFERETKLVQPAPKPESPSPAEIALNEKKLKAAKAETEARAKKQQREELEKKAQETKRKQQELARQEQLRKEAEALEEEKKRQQEERRLRQDARMRAEQDRIRREEDSALRAEVERYKEKIQSKIRHKIPPQDVAEGVEAKFYVRVLPGGGVVAVVLEKTSGNPTYDEAAERAIYAASPLPMPPNPELERLFRELRLSIKP